MPAVLAVRSPRNRFDLRVILSAALLVAVLLAPFIPLILWSFSRGWYFPALVPKWSLAAWAAAFHPASGIPQAIATSLLIAIVTTALSLAIALLAAKSLTQCRFSGRTWVLALLLAPAVVPALAVAMGLHAVALRLGLTGTIAGVVVVHLIPAMPYAVVVLSAVLRNHDPSFEAAARSLGASKVQGFRHVTLPMLAPGVAVAAALVFLVSWSQYTLTLLIGGGRVITLPLILTQFAGAGRNDIAGVVAILTILPGALVLALAAPHLSKIRPRRARVGRS